MTPDAMAAAAKARFQAERTGCQIGLLSLARPGITLHHPGAEQAALVALKRAAGGRG